MDLNGSQEKSRTNIRLYPLVFGMALGAVMAILVTGCERQQEASAGASAPSTMTVGTEIDDTVVTTKVRAAFLADKEVKGFDIKVQTRKGTVLLSGFVDSQARLDRAISLARGVEGVTGVESGMAVKDGNVSVGNEVDDGIVTAKVKSALLEDPSVKSFDIAVVTRKGEVQLSGFVDNQAQIDRAIVVARAVDGAQAVVNEMSMKK